MTIITSNQNSKIKEIIKLKKTNKRKKSDLFIIEGSKEIGLAMMSGIKISSVFYCADFLKEKTVLNSLEAEKFELDKNTFEKISLRENPDGLICLATPRYQSIKDIKLNSNPFILILESVEKPGNLGAILRTADACGVDYVIICEAKTDIYNPNVIRASLGTVFTNNIIISSNKDVISWLKTNYISSFAATPDSNTSYTNSNFSKATAIVIGTEHEGLSKEWLESTNHKIKIPMNGKIDSLNASVSAAIILFEVVRQRTK